MPRGSLKKKDFFRIRRGIFVERVRTYSRITHLSRHFSHTATRASDHLNFTFQLNACFIIILFISKLIFNSNNSTMKFSALTLFAATCVAPVAGEFYMKENFNDDVSDEEDSTK